jgi:hypothetical protein
MLKDPNLKYCTVNDVLIDRHLALEVWQVPEYNRETTDTKKVNELVEALLREPVLRYDHFIISCRECVLRKVDCNHRVRAFEKSGLPAIRVNIHYIRFDSEEEEVEAYRQKQYQLKRSTPNDRLKVVARTHQPLQRIAELCNFVTFDKACAGQAGKLVTMSTVVQVYEWSKTNPPRSRSVSSIEDLAKTLTAEDAAQIVEFLLLCREYFEVKNPSLWKVSNLTLCLWLYRRLIWREEVEDTRWSRMTSQEFGSGLGALSNTTYAGRITNKTLSHDTDRNAIWRHLIGGFRQGLGTTHGRTKLKTPNIAGYAARKGR